MELRDFGGGSWMRFFRKAFERVFILKNVAEDFYLFYLFFNFKILDCGDFNFRGWIFCFEEGVGI